jgi:hypothetical protein
VSDLARFLGRILSARELDALCAVFFRDADAGDVVTVFGRTASGEVIGPAFLSGRNFDGGASAKLLRTHRDCVEFVAFIGERESLERWPGPVPTLALVASQETEPPSIVGPDAKEMSNALSSLGYTPIILVARDPKAKEGRRSTFAKSFDSVEAAVSAATEPKAAAFAWYVHRNRVRDGLLYRKDRERERVAVAPGEYGNPPKIEDVAELDSFAIDLDPGEGVEAEVARAFALGLLKQLELLVPLHYLMDSGRGIQAAVRLAKPALPDTDEWAAALALAERIEAWLEERNAAGVVKVDPVSNPNRFVRLPGSVNLKTGRTARLLEESRATVADPSALLADVATKKQRRKSTRAPHSVSIARDSARIESVDSLPEAVPSWCRALIASGRAAKYPSRNEAQHAVTCELVRAGCDDETIFGVLTNQAFGVSDTIYVDGDDRRRPDPEGYAIRQIERARDAVASDTNTDEPTLSRTRIYLRRGRVPEIVDEVESALIARGCEVYQRGQVLSHVVQLDGSASVEADVARPPGAIVLAEARPRWLREQMMRAAEFLQYDARSNKWVPADPPLDYAQTYIDRVGKGWRLRALAGFVQAPTLRADGSVLQEPGYDRESRLLYLPGDAAFPLVPDAPTREEAMTALELLEEPFRLFPFVTPADRSVVIAAILTGLVRRSLPASPMFVFDASTAGTGKSYLAECVGIIVTGAKPAHISQGATAEEDEKRLSSVLMLGDQIISIDNCDRAIEGHFLCTMLTQEMVAVRVLGGNEVRKLPSNALVLASGNNVKIVGDVTRRVLVCRIDSGEERPEERQFPFDPRDVCRDRRPEMVSAGLTVLRAYSAAGRPSPLPKIGSFEKWNPVREALVWLGRVDPAETRARVKANDTRHAETLELLEVWHAVHGDKPVTARDVVGFLYSPMDHVDPPERHGHLVLLNKLLVELAGEREQINAKKLGWRLRDLQDRRFGAYVLRREDGDGRARWRVEKRAD